MKLLKSLGVSWIDLILFLVFAGIYTGYGVVWTLTMASDPHTLLQTHKDMMYYLLWACAIGYAILSNTAALWSRAPRAGVIAFAVMPVIMAGAFFGLTAVNELLREAIQPSVKVLSIAISDLLVLMPMLTATVVFIIAWLFVGLNNHQREQPVTQGLIRLGLGLMLMPIVQFLVIFFLPRWDDEVRGVVFVHAMGLGLLWGLFLAGGLGANLRRPATGNGAAAPAK
ncbi:MAG TPA: hypothetical protein VGE07_07815 [Herpetosiphonaceae bacterium]